MIGCRNLVSRHPLIRSCKVNGHRKTPAMLSSNRGQCQGLERITCSL
jgi:hypothetical protein